MGHRNKSNPDSFDTSAGTILPHQVKGASIHQVPQHACSGTSSIAGRTKTQSPNLGPPLASSFRAELSTVDNKVGSDGTHADEQNISDLKSWYGRSWLRKPKSLAITQIVKESVSAANASAPEPAIHNNLVFGKPPKQSTPTKSSAEALARTLQVSHPALPLVAATTKVSTSSEAPMLPRTSQVPSSAHLAPQENGQLEITICPSTQPTNLTEARGTARNAAISLDADADADLHEAETHFGWLAWFQKITTPPKGNVNSSQPTEVEGTASTLEFSKPLAKPSQPSKDTCNLPSSQKKVSGANPVASILPASPTRPWLTFWSTSGDDEVASDIDSSIQTSKAREKGVGIQLANSELGDQGVGPQDGSSNRWNFWPRSKPLDQSWASQCIVDEGVISPIKGPNLKVTAPSIVNKVKPPTQNSSQDIPVTNSDLPKSTTPSASKASKAITVSSQASDVTAVRKAPSESRLQTLEVIPASSNGLGNILLPRLKETFGPVETPGWIQTLSQYLSYNKAPAPKHLNVIRDPPRIGKAIAIGVHGYFPAPVIRSILGQPTGTSVKFADMAESAIQRWTKQRGYSCSIAKVALEGEGRIGERVDLLWKLMLNWLDDIRKADFIFVACHSQGVPVALILLAKLISFGCINGAQIAVCAMAGVNLGPFPEYKSRWIGGSAGELFEFAKADSTVTSDYIAALRNALSFGAKIVYIGSIDDQLVSLESSTFGPLKHPHIFRAVFVNGKVHAPDFLTHLVGFALKVRNLGISDHGLIRELSSPLAGSLYGGEGHSKLYEEPTVYDLAIEYALETSSLNQFDLEVSRLLVSSTAQNPYILPFSMRGVLEEDLVRTNLRREVSVLLNQFDDWKPSTKVLKDVKFRLEGIRSKL